MRGETTLRQHVENSGPPNSLISAFSMKKWGKKRKCNTEESYLTLSTGRVPSRGWPTSLVCLRLSFLECGTFGAKTRVLVTLILCGVWPSFSPFLGTERRGRANEFFPHGWNEWERGNCRFWDHLGRKEGPTAQVEGQGELVRLETYGTSLSCSSCYVCSQPSPTLPVP